MIQRAFLAFTVFFTFSQSSFGGGCWSDFLPTKAIDTCLGVKAAMVGTCSSGTQLNKRFFDICEGIVAVHRQNCGGNMLTQDSFDVCQGTFADAHGSCYSNNLGGLTRMGMDTCEGIAAAKSRSCYGKSLTGSAQDFCIGFRNAIH